MTNLQVALLTAAGLAALVLGLTLVLLWRRCVHEGWLGMLEAGMRTLMLVMHRPRLVGFERAPFPEGGFLVVANHISGLDAPLMQIAVPRRVRFMMAVDQMHPWLSWLWRRLDSLPVHYGPQDAGMLRQAARFVKNGGVVGLFPERGIARTPCTIAPFAEGVGVLVALTGAPVVLCWSRGPRSVGNALLDPFIPRRRAHFELVGVFDFAKEGVREPAEICRRLRQALAERSGWAAMDKA